MKKQYINASNRAPGAGSIPILALCMAIKVYNLPAWLYGAVGMLGLMFLISFTVRLFTEEGVDVVKR